MISYKPLFKLLLEKDLKKTDLKNLIGLSSSTLAKMSKSEYISLKIVNDLCKTLDCKIEDIIEYIPDKE